MRRFAILLPLLCAALAAEDYKLGPNSQRQPGVPKGKVEQRTWTSKIFPGTVRDWWIYVPAQYTPEKPAAVMIFQDGGGFVKEDGATRIPVVFDNLIAKGDMPVTIGIFINPGVMPARTHDQQSRFNRSFEYDAVSDRYARFLIEEILPEVSKQYNLSKDPNDYALSGSSSGGIAAFAAAWYRPDAFRRVLSFVGSFTDLRGADIFPALIRKTEPKPLRVFLQDGEHDQDIYGGSWYLANQSMFSALQYAGYDSKFVVGTEGHNMKQGSAIMPDTLRWLWRDYSKPIEKSKKKIDRHVNEFLDPDSEWELVGQGYKFTEGPAVDKQGNVYFADVRDNKLYKIGPGGKPAVFKEDTGGISGLMFGDDGTLYACQNGRKRIVAYSPDGKEKILAEGINSNDLAVTKNGDIYFSDPPDKQVWLIDSKGSRRVVYDGKGIDFPNGVRLSPDQSLLLVADTRSKWVWSFQIQPDGSLANEQAFYHLETPDDSSMSGADGMTLDTDGFLYVATKLGIQICDPPGRVMGIINKPWLGGLSNVVLGGADMQMMYVTAGDKVYRRHIRHKGAVGWTMVKPPQPRL
jgi:gluconolactonase